MSQSVSNHSFDWIAELTAAKKKFATKAERVAHFDNVSKDIKKERDAKNDLMARYRAGEPLTEDGFKPFGGGEVYMLGEKTPRTHKQINGAPMSAGALAYIAERESTGRKLKEVAEEIPTLPKPRSKEDARKSFEKFSNVCRQTKTGGN